MNNEESLDPSTSAHDPGLLVPRPWIMAFGGALFTLVIAIGAYSLVAAGGAATPLGGGGPGPAPGGQQGPAPGGGFQQGQGGFQQQPGQPPLNNNGGQQQQQRPGGGFQQPPAMQALPRTPDLTGVVQAVGATSITVNTPSGQQIVKVDGSTMVFRMDGSAGTLTDVARNATIAVVTARDADRSLYAEALAILQLGRN